MIFLPFRRSRHRLPFVIAGLLLLALGAGLLLAQPATPASTTFTMVYVAGHDTIGVEHVVRSSTEWTGDLRMRGQPRMRWMQPLNEPDGVHTLHVDAWSPGAAESDAPMQRLVLQVRGDSAYVHAAPAAGAALGAPAATLPARAGAAWLVNQSLTHGAWMVQRARARAGADTTWIVLAAGARLFPGIVAPRGDTLTFTLAGLTSTYLFDADGTPRLVAVPTQGLTGRVVPGAAAVRDPDAAPVSYEAPAGAPYSAEDVEIATPMGHTLAGTLTRPQGTAPVPVAITISGSGPQERDEAIPGVEGYRPFRAIADTLGRRGIAVLRLDDRGTGKSGGNFATSTSRDFADDVRAAVAWLRARADIDGDRIALVGHSEGGLIAPLVAADDERIAAIALLAGPAYTGARIIAFQQRWAIAQTHASSHASVRDSLFREAQRELNGMAESNPWIREFLTYDPLPTARRVRAPVLVLQGEQDLQVTAEQADTLTAAFRAGGNRDVTVHRLQRTNHLFQRDPSGLPSGYGTLPDRRVTPETLGLLADWLAEKLRQTR